MTNPTNLFDIVKAYIFTKKFKLPAIRK